MTFELLIIFLIIAFSLLFKYAEHININTQFMFIFLCIATLIIYKYMLYYRLNKNVSNQEGFFNFSSEVNKFLNNDNMPNNSTPESVQEYKNKLTELNDKVDIMNEYLQEINNIAKGNTDNKANSAFDELNIQASQQIQDYRIKQLQKEIEQTTDLIKKSKLNQDSKNFKKIPVYSSCIISNADGSMSVDNPSPNSNSNSSSRDSNNIINLNNQIANRTSQPANISTSGGVNGNSSNNGNMMANLFNTIQEKGIDINIES